ncbi:stage II sporulation protein M [Natrononativus amylolyticus]|uniref:stage II sporulation protein M n=1 Tax=Natrononativus amylolyticus TaxID=2963434 RepID=UPI0020CBB889|nr:stage II sporulation protein M [Natrononativus amylolyticus]
MTDRSDGTRSWLAVSLVVVLATIATGAVAVVDRGEPTVALGAALTAVAIVALSVTAPDRLSAAWAEHRRYVWFATGLFAVGSLLGAVLLLAGIDLTELFLELVGDELGLEDGEPGEEFELELTATFFILNNTPPFVMSILGAFTLGVFTAFVMVLNGVLVGNIALSMAGLAGVGFIVVGLAPHGIFELPALFVASGVGFRLVHRFGQRVLGTRESFLTRAYLSRTGLLVLFAWLVLVVAAFVEAYVTPALLEALFGAGLEDGP